MWKKFPLDSALTFIAIFVFFCIPWATVHVSFGFTKGDVSVSGFGATLFGIPLWVALVSFALAFGLDLLRAFEVLEIKRGVLMIFSILGTLLFGFLALIILFSDIRGEGSFTAAPFVAFVLALIFTILTSRASRFPH